MPDVTTADDPEKRCLLTPGSSLHNSNQFSLAQSSSSMAGSCARSPSPSGVSDGLIEGSEPAGDGPLICPLIYSEPALAAPLSTCHKVGYSESALPHMYLADSGVSSLDGGQTKKDVSFASTPKGSICLSDISFVQGRSGHKTSFSAREISEQHAQIQKKYRGATERQRNPTDPVDFEGILRHIGGCSWWQIWVYVLISMQQIPHAMFNLNVVYMTYQPEHWCQVPGFGDNDTSAEYLWTLEDTFNTSIVFPRTSRTQRDQEVFHDQCYYLGRSEERYKQLRRMPLDEAEREAMRDAVDAEPIKCAAWHYKKDVMHTTIVTDWNLVCDDNLKRGHAHLFYSFGFLVGCILGGLASDSFGRKPTVIGFGILSSMFGMFLPYTTYFPMFLFIRFCSAVCNEAADLAAYILCMEITGVRYRAMVGSLLQAPWAVGYAFLALLAYFCKSWKMIQAVASALHFIAVLMICALPESPRWLMVSDRVSEAEQVIRKACRTPPFPFNLCGVNKGSLPCDLELTQHKERTKWVRDRKASLFDVFKSRELRSRTFVVCTVFMATALVYYGLVIALSDQSAPGRVLFSGNFFVNNAIAGAIELPTLIACVYLMRFGRKRAQMFTLIAAGVAIIVGMLAVTGKHYMTALAFMMLGKIFIQGAFNILYIFTSELYPTVVRNSAVGLSSMIARFGAGVSSYIAMLSDVTLPIVPMSIFAIFSLFAGMLVSCLPETCDQPLPETLEDAVTNLRSENRNQCYTFGMGGRGVTNSISLVDEPGVTTNSSSVAGTPLEGSEEPEAKEPRRRLSRIGMTSPRKDAPSRQESRTDSIFYDLNDISIPDKLPEAFE